MRHSYFSAALQVALEENDLNQVQLARASGLAVSRINNYLSGDYRTVTPEHLSALCGALPPHSPAVSNLVEAYLRDCIPLSLARLIEFHGRDRPVYEKNRVIWCTPEGGEVRPKLARDFWEFRALCAAFPRVRKYTQRWIETIRDSRPELRG